MATKNNPGKFDCYENAHPDEPMFILLARDRHAPTLVWLWAAMRELDGDSPEQIEEARECVKSMIEYQIANGRQGVGLAHAAITGMLELVRAANYGAEKKAPNAGSTEEFLRCLLGRMKYEDPEKIS